MTDRNPAPTEKSGATPPSDVQLTTNPPVNQTAGSSEVATDSPHDYHEVAEGVKARVRTAEEKAQDAKS